MSQYVGTILEFHLEPDGRRTPWIACDSRTVPGAGEYLLADAPADPDALLPEPLFLQQKDEQGFLAAPLPDALPAQWDLGTELRLRGPLGKGFTLPANTRNLALAAAGDTNARLLPLLAGVPNAAFFTRRPAHELPTHVEVQPLEALPEAFAWADFTVVDLPIQKTDQLSELLGGRRPNGQVLIASPMPCGGLADCGVCAVKAGKKYRLLCKDGPVLDLRLFADLPLR